MLEVEVEATMHLSTTSPITIAKELLQEELGLDLHLRLTLYNQVLYLITIVGRKLEEIEATSWIAAAHALQHVNDNMSQLAEVFSRWKIQESEYIVHAGFDESLIQSDVGYLEQIHVLLLQQYTPPIPSYITN
ncbi:hypothetical protein BYT27DRAFT_7209126 [Phlegmacium glaucopus]|nr:hypothetical protein BYT27DRAFT_7209126 [Phlegmacium glaucopus]